MLYLLADEIVFEDTEVLISLLITLGVIISFFMIRFFIRLYKKKKHRHRSHGSKG